MEPTRFEDLLRSISAAASRRGVLRALATGAVAGLVGRLAGEDGDAKRRLHGAKKGKKPNKPKGCKRGQKRCLAACIPKSACCTSLDCVYCQGEVCQQDHTCRCNPGTVVFNGVCGFKPDCLPVPDNTGNGPAKCCSGSAQYEVDSGTWTCVPGKERCLSDADCATGTVGRCKGFMCPERFHDVTGCNF
jgi:hypothetical protein